MDPASPSNTHSNAALRQLALWMLLFAICLGLGYPALNRFDPRKAISDVAVYAQLVVSGPEFGTDDHMQARVLVPYVARPFYRSLRGHVGTWDPVIAGLLIVDSAFVASTAWLLFLLATELFDTGIALMASFLYLETFAVANLRLLGMVDPGEGFFLMAIFWALYRQRYWVLPIWGVLGALTKESFVPFSLVLTASWLLAERATPGNKQRVAWMAVMALLVLATSIALQSYIRQQLLWPWQLARELNSNANYFRNLWESIWDRNFWYSFAWLLPLGLFRLKKLPLPMVVSVAATSVTAFALNAYYHGAPGTVGRAFFSIAGPVLTVSFVLLVADIFGHRYSGSAEVRW